ncbi:response regulator receiver protein [Oleidesulfovibrio alaskensis G20]|uniref:Response regulator receiver protein n=1 Tax=Oleidesulfovibrio alaskensis (strain ATCC BAA-1058 / DSM 17464 / G20) TaxID=207559 RepID=Q30YT7_OLEA2|nr:AAA family ATPase [Oleidesulfovibrio alaskensis]ABB39159.1 response regulator receiver protein [Oleidesulfovibrio alaskensis G20]MBG0772079.1 AAA family ATPase [Oleidesulfovibrio alaskensis]
MASTYPVCLLTRNLHTEEELSRLIGHQKHFHLATPGVSEDMGLVIVELGGTPQDDFDAIVALAADPRVGEVFITAPRKDPDVIIRAMRAGVTGFLEQPFSSDNIAAALEGYAARMRETETAPQPAVQRQGRIIHVLGAKSGSGATTVTVNLGVNSARNGRSTAVMDMRLPQGEVPLFLDMQYARTWADAARELHRLDHMYLQSLMERHESGLEILAAPDENDAPETLSERSVRSILRLLRTRHDAVLIDGGPYADELALVSMHEADEVLLVSELSLPALAGARRLLNSIAQTAPDLDGKIRLVINRHAAGSGLSQEEAETLLERKACCLIENDYEAAVSAVNQGVALCDAHPRSPAAKSLTALADILMPQASPADTGSMRPRSLLARFMPRRPSRVRTTQDAPLSGNLQTAES